MKRKQIELLVIGILVLCAVVFFGYAFLNPDSEFLETKNKETEAKTTNSKIDGNAVYVIAKECVRPLLKSPSTADFPFRDYEHQQIDSVTHTIKSYVDSQNGFGAMVRTNYLLKLRYNGGEWADRNSWTVIDIVTN